MSIILISIKTITKKYGDGQSVICDDKAVGTIGRYKWQYCNGSIHDLINSDRVTMWFLIL